MQEKTFKIQFFLNDGRPWQSYLVTETELSAIINWIVSKTPLSLPRNKSDTNKVVTPLDSMVNQESFDTSLTDEELKDLIHRTKKRLRRLTKILKKRDQD